MLNVDLTRLNGLAEDFRDLARQFPAERRALMETVGERIRETVVSQIDASGLNDANGNVKRWQIVSIGSGGGYAAVRPAGKKEGAPTGNNSPGAITNYLNSGHRVRRPSGRDPSYHPRFHVVRTREFPFYEASQASAEAAALQEAQAFIDRIAERMGGG